MYSFICKIMTFSGRASRRDFWLGTVLFPMLLAPIFTPLPALLGMPGVLISLAIVLLCMAIGVTICVRRLHDREMSAHWLWLFVALPGALELRPQWMDKQTITIICAFVQTATTIWYFIELGFRRGSRGDNRYGADPLSS
ncbi:MAG: hypothetical protein JWM36_2985 [Hyphomicrobiales bacterium]|nr:hypothetical protein [Hyphomicrobiales bacterium]